MTYPPDLRAASIFSKASNSLRIERQARFLEIEQRELLHRLKRIQYQQLIPKQFARLSDHERIELIEGVADPISDMLDRLRDKAKT